MSDKPLEKIMLIEDEEDIRTVALMALETVGGFQVEALASGEAALTRLEEAVPDLIILDYMMPGMDGARTLAAIRALPNGTSVPVVFLTARVQAREIERYRRLGAIDVLVKPFDPMRLADQVRDAWSKRHAWNPTDHGPESDG